MDPTVGAVVAAALLVVVAIVALLVVRGRLKLKLRGPFDTGVDVDGEPATGVRLDRVRSGRDLKATGPAVTAKRVDAGRDATFDAGDRGEAEPPKG